MGCNPTYQLRRSGEISKRNLGITWWGF